MTYFIPQSYGLSQKGEAGHPAEEGQDRPRFRMGLIETHLPDGRSSCVICASGGGYTPHLFTLDDRQLDTPVTPTVVHDTQDSTETPLEAPVSPANLSRVRYVLLGIWNALRAL